MADIEQRPAAAAGRQLPWIELLRHGRAAHTVTLNLGIGLHAVDVFVVTTVMPAVVRDLGGVAFYAWAMMVYMVASIIGAVSGPIVSAALGARRGYVLAALIFFFGTVGCAISPVMAAFLVARTIQGFGGGLIVAQSMGLVRELYEDALRTRAIAAVSGVWAVASLLGPLLGGAFGEIGWWRGAFIATLPAILIFVLLAWRRLPPSGQAVVLPHFPIRRLALLAGGVLAVGINGTIASVPLQILLVLVAALAVLLTFKLDGEAERPLFPPRPLSLHHPAGVAFWMFFLQSITHGGAGLFLPLALQELHGLGPLAAGYFAAILALGWTTASFVTAGWSERAIAIILPGGPAIAAVALGIVALGIVPLPPLVIGICMAAAGFGIGACSLHLTAATMAAASGVEGQRTAAAIPTVRMIGIAFGAAIAGMIANFAGLGGGISFDSVAAASGAVIATSAGAAVLVSTLSFRLLRQMRNRA